MLIKRENMVDILGSMVKTSRKSVSELFNMFKMEFAKDKATFTFNNGQVYTKAKFNVKDGIEGVYYSEANKMYGLLKEIVEPEVEVDIKDNTFVIKTSKSEYRLQLCDGSSYPEFPEAHGITWKMNKEKLMYGIKQVIYATTNDGTILSSVKFELEKGSYRLVASNGFILVIQSVEDGELQLEEPVEFTIDIESVKDIVKLLSSVETETVEFSFDSKILTLRVNDGEIVVSYISDALEFPNYKTVLEKAVNKPHFVINPAALINAIKRLLVLSEEYDYIKLSVEDDKLIVSTVQTHDSEGYEVIQLEEFYSKPEDVVLSGSNLMEILKHTVGLVEFTINGTLQPVYINNSKFGYEAVQMPIRT